MNNPKRYELTQAQWERLEKDLPGKAGDPGRTGADNRTFVNAVLWQIQDSAQALYPLGQCQGVGQNICHAGQRPRQ
jgi:transposase